MRTVLIVEDHRLLAETLRLTLTDTTTVVDIVAPRPLDTLLAELLERPADLILLDLDLGAVGDSTGLIAPLTRAGRRVVLVTGTDDRERLALAFEAGAWGYCAKADSFDALVARTREALDSTRPLDADLRRTLAGELAALRATRTDRLTPFAALTDREAETLRALADGLSVHDISVEWTLSEATVRSHVRGVLTKLDTPSQLAAVALAHKVGWLG